MVVISYCMNISLNVAVLFAESCPLQLHILEIIDHLCNLKRNHLSLTICEIRQRMSPFVLGLCVCLVKVWLILYVKFVFLPCRRLYGYCLEIHKVYMSSAPCFSLNPLSHAILFCSKPGSL